jgi:ribose 5-phosphate isomerase A
MDVAQAKRRAGAAAADAVTDDTVVGLGTGSTAAYAIRALGDRVANGLDIRGVPTSLGTRDIAREAGVPLVELSDVESVDVAIDGADQVFDGSAGTGDVLLKGGGGAHLREKVVASAAEALLVVVDERKPVAELDHDVPLEVLPDARSTVAERVRSLGGEPVLRQAERKDGPVVTDNGNLLIDADFGTFHGGTAGSTGDIETLARDLAAIPGLLAHGLFVDLADAVYVGTPTGVDVLEK